MTGLTPTKIIVNSCSLELDRCLAPGARGILKHLVRRSALKVWPWGSQKTFVYLATALCDCDVPAAMSAE